MPHPFPTILLRDTPKCPPVATSYPPPVTTSHTLFVNGASVRANNNKTNPISPKEYLSAIATCALA